MKKSYFVIFSCFLFLNAFSQSFTPIKLTGFNYDGVAEAAPAANFVSGSLDGSANVLYSKAFALANDVPYGLEDSGSYTLLNLYKLQLQPYNQNNMLRVLSGQNATLNFVTPYKYNTLLLFCFNTESDNNISYTINFSDGTIQNGTSMVPDWFYGADPIAQGIGRISSYDDILSGDDSNPRIYYKTITILPANINKNIQSITFYNTTSSKSYIVGISGQCSGLIDPIVTGTQCCSNTAATLTTSGADIFVWKDAGGNVLGTGPTYTTPVLAANTNYYLYAANGIASAPLQTTFAAGSIQRGAMFNLTAANNLKITGFDISKASAANYDIEVYYREGGYSGFENNPGAWTLLGSTPLTGAANTPLYLPIGELTIPAGKTYGIYITSTDNTKNLNYTTGSASYYDGALTITTGAGISYPFLGAATAGNWNGRVHYINSICANIGKTVPVTVTAPSVISISKTDIDCAVVSGTATVTAIGNAPFLYEWNTVPVQTTSTATGLNAGSYTVKVTNSNGCFQTASVTINQLSSLIVTKNQTNITCSGAADGAATVNASGGMPPYSYSWSSGGTDNTVTGLSQGTYTVTIADSNGCSINESFTIIPLDITAPVAITQNITLPLDATGHATLTPAQINNGSIDNCAIASMALDITSFDCSKAGANTVTLTVTDTAGNTASATATVTVTDATAPVAITQNITLPLDATGHASLAAAQINNGSDDNCAIASMALDITSFDCSKVGANTVTLTVTDTAGNTASATAIVNVTINPVNTPITNFTLPTAVCIGDVNPTPVTADGFTLNGVFSATNGLAIDPITGTINLSTSTDGIYVITYTVAPDTTTCNPGGHSEVTITINPLKNPITSFAYITPTCVSSENQLPVTSEGFTFGGIYTTTEGLIINNTTGEIDIMASAPGTYTVTYTLDKDIENCIGAGTSMTEITIKAVDTPIVVFNYEDNYCSGIENTSPVFDDNFNFGGTFSSQEGLAIDINDGTVNLFNSIPGTYTVTYTIMENPEACNTGGTHNDTFTILDKTTFSLEGNCDGNGYVLTASPVEPFSNTATFEWSTAEGIIVESENNTFNVSDYINNRTGSFNFPTAFTLTVMSDGCKRSETIILDHIDCSIQKGISPNGDGKNDVLELSHLNIKQLEIFNRYGNKVYTKANYKNEWYGQDDKDNKLPTGTYYYIIQLLGKENKSGWIYINRQE